MKKRLIVCGTALLGLGISAFNAAAQDGINVVRYLSQETDPAVVAIQREWVNGFISENPALM